ncbi:MAG: GGDEF domain-containing protein [Oscillospiraceae bacterium]|nr:GGDEF domain-containing protein [Oscillospiraceae bacterium]
MISALYAEVYLVCFTVVALMLYWVKRGDFRSKAYKLLSKLFIAVLFNFGANLLFTVSTSPGLYSPETSFVSYALKTIYHVSLSSMVLLWTYYAESEERSGLMNMKAPRDMVFILISIPIASALINPFTHWLFELGPDGEYRRGPMFQVEMAVLLFITCFAAVRLIMRVRSEPDPVRSRYLKVIASFPLSILAAWVLSYMGETVPVICVSIMVELLCIFMGTVRLSIALDPLTGVNNRQNLKSYVEHVLRTTPEEIYVLMMDVDKFKHINDTYGHLAGDEALVRVAQAIKDACGEMKKRPYIARYGGDEFVIVAQSEDSEMNALCRRIDENLSKCGEPFALRVSIGSAKLGEGMDGEQLFAAADSALYSIKNARRSAE